MKEIDRNCKSKAIENKKKNKNARSSKISEKSIWKNITTVLPQFEFFFESLSDKLELETVKSKENNQEIPYPVNNFSFTSWKLIL